MVGIVFAVVATAAGALGAVTMRRGALTGSALQGLVIINFTGIPLFAIAALMSGQIFQYASISPINYLILILTGINHYVIGRYASIRAVDAMGTTRAMPLMQAASLVSVIAAVIFLSEVVTLLMGIGIALVMTGPVMVALKSSRPSNPNAPPARLVAGYLWGMLNAVAFGISPVLIRHVQEDSGSGLSILMVLVTYSSAVVFLLPGLMISSRMRGVLSMDKASQGWFLLVAISFFTSHLFLFMALGIAPVSIVMPLMGIGPIFAILFAYILSRQVETFTPQVISGILVTVTGSAILVW
jgi:drug/metabolite transporter (DMT)-like permease